VVSRARGFTVVAVKLKDHRLKPGGVPGSWVHRCSGEIERPPAEARWSRARRFTVVAVKLKDRRLKPGCTSIIDVAPQLPTDQPFEPDQRLNQHAFLTRPVRGAP